MGLARLKVLQREIRKAFLQLGDQSPAGFMDSQPHQALFPFVAQSHIMSNQQHVGCSGLRPVDRANLSILEAEVLFQELVKAFLLQIGNLRLPIDDGDPPRNQVNEPV
jgi:hypothetical protein